MTLRKRYKRNLKNNFSFYICICILTSIVVILYLDFAAAASKTGDDLNYFFKEFKVEDAQFTVDKEIGEEDIERLEKEYGIILEKQRYMDFKAKVSGKSDETGFEVRLLSTPKKLNLYVPGDGDVLSSAPGSDVEEGRIIMNISLAEGNGISKGDTIELGGLEFEYGGSFERPDYLFTIREVTDTFCLKSEFGIGLVDDETFDRLAEADSDVEEYYMIRYGKENESEVRCAINDDYTMLSYLKADVNTRIKTPLNEIKEYKTMMNIVIIVLVIFISVIISVVIGRRIRNDRKQIGVLIALGYRKNELKRHYAFYGVTLGLIGTVVGVVVSFLLADKIIAYLFAKIERIPTRYSITIISILITILVPTLMYTLSVYRTAGKVMKTDVITMISGRTRGGAVSRLRIKRSHLSVKTKFKLRQIFGKPGRSLIVIIGLAFGGMLYGFCLTCIDSMDSYCKHTVNQIGSFNYEYFLKTPELGEPENGNAILGVSYEVKDRTDMVMLLGIDSPDMINFSDEAGSPIEFKTGRFYITTMASLAFDKGVGDELIAVDPITLKEYTVKITDVIKNDSQAAVYCSREDIVTLLDIDVEGLNKLYNTGESKLPYNIVMSKDPVSIDSDKLAKTITKQSLSNQINEVKKGMEDVTGVLNIFAIIICIVVVYMMVNVLITESKPSVSMLKVLGYRNNEINSMVLNIYHFLVPVALVLSILLGFYGTKAVFDANVAVYKTYLATCIYPVSVIKLTCLILASYAASLFLLRGRVGKVDLVESLKDNRE